MKFTLILLVALALAGCVTRNPAHATDPTAPAFIPDQVKLDKISGTVRGVEGATAPFNPYAPVTTPVVEGGLAIVAALSAWFAKKKSDGEAKHKAAAAALAAVVHESGLNVQAMKAAGTNGSQGEVARHLDSAASPT